MSDAAVLAAPTVTLPPYNDGEAERAVPCRIDMAQAEAIFRRAVELGATSVYSRKGRAPTAEEQAAFQAGTLIGMSRKPYDRFDRLSFIYVQGPFEQALEEFGLTPPHSAGDYRRVQVFFDIKADAERREARAKHRAKFEGEVEAFFAATTLSPAAERFLRKATRFSERNARVPKAVDLHDHWTNRLNSVTNPYGGATTAEAPYSPEPSGFKLKLREAVSYGACQDTYADHSYTLIPVETCDPTDVEAANRNLAKIARKLNTHNGWAGSGTGYGLTLSIHEDGIYVLMDARHSISD